MKHTHRLRDIDTQRERDSHTWRDTNRLRDRHQRERESLERLTQTLKTDTQHRGRHTM